MTEHSIARHPGVSLPTILHPQCHRPLKCPADKATLTELAGQKNGDLYNTMSVKKGAWKMAFLFESMPILNARG